MMTVSQGFLQGILSGSQIPKPSWHDNKSGSQSRNFHKTWTSWQTLTLSVEISFHKTWHRVRREKKASQIVNIRADWVHTVVEETFSGGWGGGWGGVELYFTSQDVFSILQISEIRVLCGKWLVPYSYTTTARSNRGPTDSPVDVTTWVSGSNPHTSSNIWLPGMHPNCHSQCVRVERT